MACCWCAVLVAACAAAAEIVDDRRQEALVLDGSEEGMRKIQWGRESESEVRSIV